MVGLDRDQLVGRRLGNHEILSKLGAGGMGAVYRARHTELDKIRALKVLPPQAMEDKDAVERFRREARIAASLEHPNITAIYDFGCQDNIYYLVMRLVEGESLADRLAREKKLDLAEALFIMHEVAVGLGGAHEAKLVHRDIKPANILLSTRGEVLIADFGLAKHSSDGGAGLTATGVILGTPDYMAPEQCEGLQDIDGRADLYSLGLVFYTMLTGAVTSKGRTPLQIIMHRVRNDVPSLDTKRPDLSGAINGLVMSLLRRDRDQRLHPADALIKKLVALPEFEQVRSMGKLKVPAPKISPQDVTMLVPPPPSSQQARPSGSQQGSAGVSVMDSNIVPGSYAVVPSAIAPPSVPPPSVPVPSIPQGQTIAPPPGTMPPSSYASVGSPVGTVVPDSQALDPAQSYQMWRDGAGNRPDGGQTSHETWRWMTWAGIGGGILLVVMFLCCILASLVAGLS